MDTVNEILLAWRERPKVSIRCVEENCHSRRAAGKLLRGVDLIILVNLPAFVEAMGNSPRRNDLILRQTIAALWQLRSVKMLLSPASTKQRTEITMCMM